MIDALYDEMYSLESRYWWFCAKRKIVLRLLRKHLAGSPGDARVADFGCGCGMMLEDLRAHGYQATGIDASDKALEYCRQRGAQVRRCRLPDELDVPEGTLDAVLMLDVLEHLEDDHACFARVMRTLRPGGVMVATVPACPWLWTPRDEFHHHKRRYSYKSFRKMLEGSGQSRVRMTSYMNTFLFPAALLSRLAGKFLPPRPTDLKVPPWAINKLLEWTYVSESLLFANGIRLPIGLSLVGVVEKTQ